MKRFVLVLSIFLVTFAGFNLVATQTRGIGPGIRQMLLPSPLCLMASMLHDTPESIIATAQETPEPPPDWFCSYGGRDDHACSCHRECRDQTVTTPDGEVHHPYIQEDPHCKVFCHQSHCRCEVHNCE